MKRDSLVCWHLVGESVDEMKVIGRSAVVYLWAIRVEWFGVL